MAGIIDSFNEVKDVIYKGETYSVRDNGAILRHPKNISKPRPTDNVWTFGKIDKTSGYLVFSSQRVHRIVAYAFLGEPRDASYVVDHKDTNRQNNRPENLRWVTKLENILLNDITRHKIEFICGCQIADVLKDMSILRSKALPPNFDWMKTVTDEEAKESLERWNKWCKEIEGRKLTEDYRISLIKKMYSSKDTSKEKGKYYLEPEGINVSLEDYSNNLEIGKLFYSRDYITGHADYIIVDFHYNRETRIISVATTCNSGVKSCFLTEIRREHDEFIYMTHSYFDPNSIDKYMTLARGEEWTGGPVFDDYC